MRHGRLISAIMVAAVAGVTAGQAPINGLPVKVELILPAKNTTNFAADASVSPILTPAVYPSTDGFLLGVDPGICEQAIAPNLWVDVDYLYWQMRRAPLPTPLVTTGNPTDPLPGALGRPSTIPLFGGTGLDYGNFNGARLNVGGWLDCQQSFGVEVGGFLFERRVIRFSAASDQTGNPPIYLPVINQNPASLNFGNQSIYTVADPLFPDPIGPTVGNVNIKSMTRFWGVEANGLLNLDRGPFCSIDGIVGFRYLDLRDSLRISGFSNDLFDDLQQTFNDRFSTRNQFYGGQVGARLSYHCDNIVLSATGKVAIGCTQQVVEIQGTSIWGGTGFAPPPGGYLGGVYAQPSNVGRTSTNAFGVVPQVGVKLGVSLTSCLSATVGYDLLYWNSVVQPGAQIDHNLNPTQFPGAGFIGTPLPAPLFNRNDFLAHGVSFGLTFAY